MTKKVAIVCYSFPPFPGVGGRRWAKFAKFLAMDGYEVYAIGAKNIFTEKSEWTKDVDHPGIHYISLPLMYPKVLIKGVKTITDRIIYRTSLFIFSKYLASIQ